MTDLTRRRLTQALILTYGTPSLLACGGGNSETSGTNQGKAPSTALAVFPDASDPRIIEGQVSPEERFVLYGRKDSAGKVLAAEEMQFIDTSLEPARVQFTSGSGKLLGTSEGSQVSLAPSGAAGLVFGLVAGDRQLELELVDIFKAASTSQSQALRGHAGESARVGRTATLDLSEDTCDCWQPSQAAAQKRALAVTAHAPIVEVSVSGCVGDNPSVRVIMRDDAGKVLDVVTGKKAGGGKYICVLTNLNTGDAALAEAAQAAITFLEHLDITEGAFVSIFKHLKSKSFEFEALAEEVVRYLEDAGKAADTIEDFAPFLNLTDSDVTAIHKRAKLKMFIGKKLKLLLKSIDVWDKLFAALLAGDALGKMINAYSQYKFNRLQLQPVVVTSKGTKLTGNSSGLIPPEGPYPDLTVQAPAKTEISALKLTPAVPASGQSYVAQGQVYCAAAGDVVTVSVLGSDGYSNAVSQVAKTSESQTFQLTVPGAESGVRDRVTIRIVRSGLEVAVRTADLIFS